MTTIGNPWTAEEDAILREIWARPERTAVHLHRLPGRTEAAACIRAFKLRLPRKPKLPSNKWRAALPLFAQKEIASINDVAAFLSIPQQHARWYVKRAQLAGEIHFAGVRHLARGKSELCYSAKPGLKVDVPPPPKDLKSPPKTRKGAINQPKRDPFTAAFFGDSPIKPKE